jgi:hypothetical protein
MEEVDEQELHVERIAALDLGKAVFKACVRVPHESKPGRRMQELRGYATTTSALLEMADWFRCFFTDHHATILVMMLNNIDRLSAQIAALDTTIGEAIAPFAPRWSS